MYDGKLTISASSVEEALKALFGKVDMGEFERITLFYGEGMTQTRVNTLVDQVRKDYPAHEIEVHDGGQPHYQLIIAFE